ncbi:MAG: HlyD family efflux transporter periplasmic adaptor subunit [Pseudohongiella sp.]|nr:HlyD family efflux transporter periplasmic adaptor subunit [Pseudohongiella sp.]
MFEKIQVVRTLPRLRNIGTRLGGVLVFGALISISALIVATGPSASPETRAEKEWPVSYREAIPALMTPNLQVYGKLETVQTANLRAPVAGTVSAIHFKEGDWVERGELLMSLDDAELRLNVRAAESSLLQADANRATVVSNYELARELTQHHEAQASLAASKLERFVSLHNQRMIADAQLDEIRQEANERAMTLARHIATLREFPHQIAYAEALVAEARTRLERTQLELSYAMMAAPFSGRVLAIEVAVGDRVGSGASMLRLADYEGLQIRAAIPAQIAHRLRQSLNEGESVFAEARLGGVRYGFELAGLSGDIKPGLGGIDAFFNVEADAVLALGTVLQLSLSLPAEPDVISVPMHALYDNGRIYRISNSRLEALSVERVGEYQDEHGNYQLLVRSAQLNRGDRIMVSQLPTAVTGMLVSPVDALAGVLDLAPATELAVQWSSH